MTGKRPTFGQLARDRSVQVTAALLLLTVIAAALVVPQHRHLAETSGLHGKYRSADSTTTAFEAVDRTLTESSIRSNATQLPTKAFSIVWTGYVIAPQRGTYRFWVPPCVQQLMIDRRVAGSDAMPSGGPNVEVSRGMHAVEIQLSCDGVPLEFRVEWANGETPFRMIPALLVMPELRERAEVRMREWLTLASATLPIAWLCAIVLFIATIAWRASVIARPIGDAAPPRALAAILFAAGTLFAVGVWWGIPDVESWAADEVGASDVIRAVAARFAHGWATLYPPLHYAVLALAFVPFRIAAALNLTNLDDAVTLSGLLVVGRLVSVAMALGIVAVVYRIAADVFSQRAGLFAAAVVSLSLPMAYYSKTTNLDVPYVFWLMLGLLFYLRAAATGKRAFYCWFALSATAAVCTKDQAYGFYVLPALYIGAGILLSARIRSRMSGIPNIATLLWMVAIAAVAFVVFHNLVLNYDGFREHLRLAQAGCACSWSPDREGFRMVARTLGGLGTLWWTSLFQIANGMSWPLLVAAAGGVVIGARTRPGPSALLLMPALSYQLFVISVVLYHYDRFFIGVIAILAVFAGACLDALTRHGVKYRAATLPATAAILLYALTRPVALDLFMLRDSRYDTERWLRAHVAPQQRVVAAGFGSYLPRGAIVPWTSQVPAIDRLTVEQPDVVIVNRDFAQRFAEDSEQGRFYSALARGTAGYQMAEEFQTTLPWPFTLDLTFGWERTSGYSNLTKINPPIAIYVRKP